MENQETYMYGNLQNLSREVDAIKTQINYLLSKEEDSEELLETTEPDDTVYALVETVSTFRHRYVVEVPKNHLEYAADTVVMDEAKEFSQLHLGETITSVNQITPDAILAMCDQDNEYCQSWAPEYKFDVFVTLVEDY